MEASYGCVGASGAEKAAAMTSKRDTGYIITTEEGMSAPHCNLCSSKQPTPIDVYIIGFYTRQEQNVFVINLCQTHRIDLMQAIAQTLEIRVALTAFAANPPTTVEAMVAKTNDDHCTCGCGKKRFDCVGCCD